MIAYHGKQEIKDQYLARVKAHRAADELIKGTYWENGKGCAVGCTVHSNQHASYETELGIPRLLARLEDGIFERLPNDLAMTWPERFLDAIPVGKDLSLVWPKFAHWMLLDSEYGVIRFAKTEKTRTVIQKVGELYKQSSEGIEIEKDIWFAASASASASASADAAAYAASAASAAADADAAAAYAAYAAADAAAYAASAAADAASAAAAADAASAAAAYAASAAADTADARTKWRITQSEKLLELLAE
jgi:hypothetical protein